MDHYREHLAEREHRRDPLMDRWRNRLDGLGAEHSTDPELTAVLEHLEAAAPAYRSCLWSEHDRRNRQRIGEFVSVLVRHGPRAQAALSKPCGS